MVRFITDSGADAPKELLDAYGFTVMPFGVLIDEETFFDGESISPVELYEKMRNGAAPKTFQVEVSRMVEVFTEHFKQGESFIYLAFSSELSGTYQTATMLAAELAETYPDVPYAIINTKTASTGQGLFVLDVAEFAKTHSFEETKAYAEQKINTVRHLFTVESLEYLMRGGRVSRASAFIGGLLSILPLLTVEDGKLIPKEKIRGQKKVMNRIVEWMEEARPSIDGHRIIIGHGDSIERAEQLKQLIETQFAPSEVLITIAGAAIGSHTGPGLIVIGYDLPA
ncbi:DegV family protein [Exiguobacterium sp. Helios]|uniref:DegV family protein n=1 Tax=Exiguobacterium sp. Helios TaxID=2735868 RepID=UPI00165D43B9|nr:DegV family protein [Exiguobacterium sp. Helios]QNR19892.1 DegV family protein [Exiguobacterium sp. Helios]